MSEEGEYSDNSEEEREARSDVDNSDEEEEGDVVSSLFDALAAAQEASEKYKYLEEGEQSREDHRLPDDFLVTTYSACLNLPWESSVQTKSPSEGEELQYKKGYCCEAVWPGDGQWYPAKVVRLKEWKQTYIVRYRGFDKEEEEEVSEHHIRPRVRKRKKIKHRGKKKKKIKTTDDVSTNGKDNGAKEASESVDDDEEEDDICLNAVRSAYTSA